jgi:hypothetical protein
MRQGKNGCLKKKTDVRWVGFHPPQEPIWVSPIWFKIVGSVKHSSLSSHECQLRQKSFIIFASDRRRGFQSGLCPIHSSRCQCQDFFSASLRVGQNKLERLSLQPRPVVYTRGSARKVLQALTLLVNIRPGWQNLQGTNAVEYFGVNLLTLFVR